MAQDATGAPTGLGIPTYDTTVDAPSGKGFNAAMSSIDTLLQSRVTLAGSVAWKTRLLTGDANPTFQVLGDGDLQWGAGGGSSVDTFLGRPTTGQLSMSPGPFIIAMGSANVLLGSAHALRVNTLVGDANEAFRIAVGGVLSWGPGGASGLDTNLYRSAANSLRTDDAFIADSFAIAAGGALTASGGSGLNGVLFASQSGDTAPLRFALYNDGKMEWGPGSVARDNTLYRYNANILGVGTSTQAGRFHMFGAATTGIMLSTVVTTDTQNRFRLYADGKQEWGDGTNIDTNLYRSAADVLKTDDSFNVGASISHNSAGYTTYTEITAPGNAGANAGRLFVEDNGAGKSRLAIIFNTGVKQIIATEP